MSQIGRPSKAKRNPKQLEFGRTFGILLGRENDPRLVWNLPAALIRKKLQSISGIAELAKVDRKTVWRRGIAPGCASAVEFVRDRRIKLGRPLVETRGALVDHRNASPKFLGVINSIQTLRKHFSDENAKRSAVRDLDLKAPLRRTGFGKNVHVFDELRNMTDDEREAIAQMRRFQYKPPGRVTLAQLCQFRDVSRQAFWKWRKSLPRVQREGLDLALSGEQAPSHKARPKKHRPVQDLTSPENSRSAATAYENIYEHIFSACDGSDAPHK